MFCKQVVLKNFAKFAEKKKSVCVGFSFSIRRPRRRCLIANLAKFLRMLFCRAVPVAASENGVITIWLTTSRTVVKFTWNFWKLNLMSDICEVKSQISECNLQSNVVHHLPYHMKWIWCSLHQALGILFYMLSVKFNYAAPFSLLKLFQSWFHPSARSFDLLETFLLVFCAFGYLIFLPFVRETFLILWNAKKRGIFLWLLCLLFIDISLSVLQCFSSSKF